MKSWMRSLLPVILCSCSTLAANAQTGTVEGVVNVGGAPAPFPVVVDVRTASFFRGSTTDSFGHYVVGAVPAGETVNVWVGIAPVGYVAVIPADGDTTFALGSGEVATIDFALEFVSSGPARGLGWWKHQFNANGNTYYTIAQLGQFSYWMRDHLFGIPRPLPSSYITSLVGGHIWGGSPPEVLRWLLNDGGHNGWAGNWGRHFLTVLLNVASARLRWDDVISVDGATVSQAVQQMCALSGPAGPQGPSTADAAELKDIAEAINEGRLVSPGAIDLTPATTYFGYLTHRAPAVSNSAIEVSPNPMVRKSALDFTLSSGGQTTVRVCDVAGRPVRTLIDEEMPSGRHSVSWDGRSDGGQVVPNGIYFYRVQGHNCLLAARLVVMK